MGLTGAYCGVCLTVLRVSLHATAATAVSSVGSSPRGAHLGETSNSRTFRLVKEDLLLLALMVDKVDKKMDDMLKDVKMENKKLEDGKKISILDG